MEEVDKVLLHYQMLEYLFNKCKLATSCFNHVWEGFLSEYPEYKGSLTSSELKNIFWTEIATNIDQYELLSEEQEEYFNYDGCILNISDDNLLEKFEQIEPRRESDYIFLKTEENHRQLVPQRTRVTEQNVQKVFEEPNVCTKENDIKLNIIGTKESSELDVNNEFKLSCLMMNLFGDGEDLFNKENDINIEILKRLRNPDLCTAVEHLGIASDDWSKAIYGELDETISSNLSSMLNIPKPNIESSQSNESLPSSVHSRSSLSILSPQISRTPTRSITRSLSQTTPTSQTRRQIVQNSSKSSTPSRSTRSRRALVPNPALNLKMSKFMEKHDRKNK